MATTGLMFRTAAARLSLPRRETLFYAIVAAGFFAKPTPLWAMMFYLAVLPWWGGALLSRRASCPMDAGTVVGAALILWFTMTTAWDDSSASVQAQWLWNGLCTLVFFLAARSVLGSDARAGERLVTLLLACALGNAGIAFVHAAAVGVGGGRMAGWAQTRHLILGASVMGVAVVLAAGRLLEGRTRGLAAATFAAGLAFILLTGSRGPLIAICLAVILLMQAIRPRLLLATAALGAALAGAGALAAPMLAAGLWDRLTQRGWSSRLDIWQLALHEIAEQPLFGHGPSARLARVTDNFPHNVFLSTLFYSGAIGLLLLLAMLALAARAAWRQPDKATRWTLLALIAHTVLSGLTDLSQITKGPSPLWYIVWLPVALALGPRSLPAAAVTRGSGRVRAILPADYPRA